MKLIVTYEPDEDGGFIAECPALPGCVSHGETIDEARRNIQDAIGLSLKTRRDYDLPLNLNTRDF